MYQYSLDSFTVFFKKSMRRADPHPEAGARAHSLCLSLRKTIFTWVSELGPTCSMFSWVKC
jgi:hypothetical protein